MAVINEAAIIPTGREIMDGTVLDANSPAVMYSLVCMAPMCTVHRSAPIEDNEEAICRAIEHWIAKGTDLVAVIGGSGGGHRHSESLSGDYTHSALERLLDEKASREIWGKNGHLWCKLVCGRKNSALIINLPGPYVEAKAAIEAFCRVYPKSAGRLDEINRAMTSAVQGQYPENAAK